jgi:hypothetical protein
MELSARDGTVPTGVDHLPAAVAVRRPAQSGLHVVRGRLRSS